MKRKIFKRGAQDSDAEYEWEIQQGLKVRRLFQKDEKDLYKKQVSY